MDKPLHTVAGSDQGQRDGVSGRGGLLQGQQRHRQCGQRGECSPQHQVGGAIGLGQEDIFNSIERLLVLV